MYEYIKGQLAGLTPGNAIVETGGVGYFIHISLNTYSRINGQAQIQLFLHQVVREDAHLLYGFADLSERELFRLLLSVSGVGTNTALMMLSSLSPDELRKAILEENVAVLKSVKGIGAKTALRMIIDLKDKIGKGSASDKIPAPGPNPWIREEAAAALTMLGFSRRAVDTELDKLLKAEPDMPVETLIKKALRGL